MTENQELNETSKVEEIEKTTQQLETKWKDALKLADDNSKAYLKEKQKRIDLEDDNRRLKEKLEKKTLEGLREKELERKTQREQDNLLNILFKD